jgi:hypothetical protein
LKAFVVGLRRDGVQFNNAVRSSLLERVRQAAVVRRLLCNKVAVLATALRLDAARDNPLAINNQ